MATEVTAMQTKFGNFTDQIKSNTITTVDDLIKILRSLKGEMAEVATEQLKLMRLAQTNRFIEVSSGCY